MFALFTVSGCADVLDLVEVEPPPVDVCGAKRESGSIHVQGTLLDATNNAPIVGLSVDATPGGVSPTDANGAFAIDVDTNNALLFLTLTASGVAAYPQHSIHYQRAFTAGMDASSKLLPATAIESLYGAPPPAGSATALVSLRDCNGDGIADATIAVQEAGSVVYQGGGTATNGTGVAYVLDIPAGPVTVSPSVGRPFDYQARAGELAIVYLAAP